MKKIPEKTLIADIINDQQFESIFRAALNSPTVQKQLQKLFKTIVNQVANKYNANQALAQKSEKLKHRDSEKVKEKPSRKIQDTAKLKDSYLKYLVYKHRQSKTPIPQRYQDELIRRFPAYNPQTSSFTPQKRSGTKTQAISVHRTEKTTGTEKTPQMYSPVKLYSIKKNNSHTLVFGDEHKLLLKSSPAPFELLFLDKLTQYAIVRRPDGKSQPKLYIINCKRGYVFPEIKNTGAYIIKYYPKTHELFTGTNINADVSRSHWSFKNGRNPVKVMNIPYDAITYRAKANPKETTIVEANGEIGTCPLIQLPDPNYDILPESSMIIKRSTQRTTNNNAASAQTSCEVLPETIPSSGTAITNVQESVQPQDNLLKVVVENIKLTLDGPYNNIFVNGNRILKNHINTTVKTFLDGAVLGVHGIVTDVAGMPTRPIWMIYDTKLRPRTFPYQNQYSKQNIYITNVIENTTDLVIYTSNKMQIILDAQKVKSVSDKVFCIASEKTK